MLDELDQYGGVTPTVALLDGSPAINTGDNTVCNGTAVENIDQRGFIRIDGLVGNSQCDIGAFEWHPLANRQSPLGTNMGEIGSNSTLLPLVDIFKQSGEWRPACIGQGSLNGCPHPWDTSNNPFPPPPLDIDENGWLRTMPNLAASNPPANAVRTYFFEGTANTSIVEGPSGTRRYIVTYDGTGNINYGGAASLIASQPTQPVQGGIDIIEVAQTGGNAYLDITDTDPNQTGDYIRNIRIVHQDFAANSGTNPFTPQFLDKASRFGVLRFMDLMRTNDNPPGEWSNRAATTDARYSDGGGLPLELMLQLSNQLQVAPWFSMPHTASDDYIVNFATFVRDRLNSDLPVYIEYSNETWNGALRCSAPQDEECLNMNECRYLFPQSLWVRQRAMESPLLAPLGNQNCPDEGASPASAASFHGMRTVEMCRLWDEVWGDQANRVICVNAAQANPTSGAAERVLACELWNEGPCDEDNEVDAIAVAPYFGNYIGAGGSGAVVDSWLQHPDGGMNALFEEINQGTGIPPNDSALDRAENWMQQNKTVADNHGVELIAYEGGQHLAARPAFEDLFTAANRHTLMGEAYSQYLDRWKNAGGCLFVNYTLAQSAYNRFGSWGILEYIDEVSTPKFDAVAGFIDANPLDGAGGRVSPWNACLGSLPQQ